MAAKQTITPWALRTEALRVSKKHVRAILKQKGIRESSFKASEVNALARQFLEANRKELIGKALGDLAWSRLCDWFHKVELMERHAKAQSIEASAIRKSGVQKEPELCE